MCGPFFRSAPSLDILSDGGEGEAREPREDQCDDLSIVKARYGLDKRRTLIGVEIGQPGGVGLTRESVFKHIATLMNNYDGNGGGNVSIGIVYVDYRIRVIFGGSLVWRLLSYIQLADIIIGGP